MAVVVQYIVESEGVQKMTFVSKKEADAYDKMLDVADELFALLNERGFEVGEERLEEIALHLAEHRERAAAILKGAKAKEKGEAKEEKPAAEAPKTKKRAPELPDDARSKAA